VLDGDLRVVGEGDGELLVLPVLVGLLDDVVELLLE
jgi:hypothetical protein